MDTPHLRSQGSPSDQCFYIYISSCSLVKRSGIRRERTAEGKAQAWCVLGQGRADALINAGGPVENPSRKSYDGGFLRSFREHGNLQLQRRSLCSLLHIVFLPTLLFEPEDGGDMLLRKIDWFSKDYMALCSRRHKSVWTLFKERLPIETGLVTLPPCKPYSPRNLPNYHIRNLW
jgi:hypothetical protein